MCEWSALTAPEGEKGAIPMLTGELYKVQNGKFALCVFYDKSLLFALLVIRMCMMNSVSKEKVKRRPQPT